MNLQPNYLVNENSDLAIGATCYGQCSRSYVETCENEASLP